LLYHHRKNTISASNRLKLSIILVASTFPLKPPLIDQIQPNFL
jgi:hypothetical protein